MVDKEDNFQCPRWTMVDFEFCPPFYIRIVYNNDISLYFIFFWWTFFQVDIFRLSPRGGGVRRLEGGRGGGGVPEHPGTPQK